MKYLLSYFEFLNELVSPETSSYPVPMAPIIPYKNDTGFYHIKNEFRKSANWGFNFRKQAIKNNIKRNF